MELAIDQMLPGCADGTYRITAEGCSAATLYWANQNGILENWSPLACVPIDPDGIGEYQMTGGRAVPPEADHLLARAVSWDPSRVEEVLVPVPKPAVPVDTEGVQRFLFMTDLHLSTKPWQIRKALKMAKGCDGVLITGDITNDGTQEQLERFWDCVTELIPEIPVFPVTGNHDYPARPLPQIRRGICDYPALQQKLLERAGQMGVSWGQEESGAYWARLGETEIIGLNGVTHWREFCFPGKLQLDWLREHLKSSGAGQRILLCHAPLSAHRPYKKKGDPPYMPQNRILERILEEQCRDTIFLSGHTHVSMNCRGGCVERDERGNLYINGGSIRPTTLRQEEPLQSECWTEGNVVQLLIGPKERTVTAVSVKTGKSISRGHYRFTRE